MYAINFFYQNQYSFLPLSFFFFFNDTATTEIYTLSLHDALPISSPHENAEWRRRYHILDRDGWRSEEHTSELQSRRDLVCRLLLEKKKHRQLEHAIVAHDMEASVEGSDPHVPPGSGDPRFFFF